MTFPETGAKRSATVLTASIAPKDSDAVRLFYKSGISTKTISPS